MSIESVVLSSHLILCRPLLLLPSIPPSIRVFSSESTLHMRWPKYWSFSFSIIPSKEHPGLIFFRMDWLALFAVQGTFKSFLQHHSSKASILRRSAFFTVQLSHPYMTTGKNIALIRQTLECLMNYGMRFVTLYGRQGSRPSPGKEMQKSKMAVWGGLINSCEKNRSEKRREKGKIQASEWRVPENSKKR